MEKYVFPTVEYKSGKNSNSKKYDNLKTNLCRPNYSVVRLCYLGLNSHTYYIYIMHLPKWISNIYDNQVLLLFRYLVLPVTC